MIWASGSNMSRPISSLFVHPGARIHRAAPPNNQAISKKPLSSSPRHPVHLHLGLLPLRKAMYSLHHHRLLATQMAGGASEREQEREMSRLPRWTRTVPKERGKETCPTIRSSSYSTPAWLFWTVASNRFTTLPTTEACPNLAP